MSDEVLIKVEEVSKQYKMYPKRIDRLFETLDVFGLKSHARELKALDDISFELKRGEILGIIGPNGAGKSTILKILTGVVRPSSGSVKVNGRLESLLELGSAFNTELDGLQNIDFYLKVRGIEKDKRPEIVKKIIDFAGIDNFLDQPLKTYSSGMFARLAFATAINLDFDILIVDEVLSVGDERFQNKCIQKMQEIANSGKSIIFVSHDLHAVKYFCDWVMRFEQGKVVDQGSDVINIVEKYEKNIPADDVESEVVQTSKSKYVKITDTYLLDKNGKNRNRLTFTDDFSVVIKYELKEYMDGMFFGFGFRNAKGEYVLGLNTKIDGIKIPKKPGKYTLTLELKEPMIYKDVYSMWSVCYNPTGTVVLDDYTIKNAFSVETDKQYCEGIAYINHVWKYES